MSNVVDQRVVEMRFDNKHFEQNVSTTMSTLQKLKQSLNLNGAAKGLDAVSAAAKRCDMSGLDSGVSGLSLKFSGLQVMAVTALTRITNAAIDAGKSIVSALTIDPIKTGFNEYETKINAIQTIMSNTASKGVTMADVTDVLNELNTYADKTIYNFAEMTRNIGTFTAAGVGLEESAAAIQGIANLAAASGSTSQQASTAMYQLSQALAAGTVKLMDWNSVVNAGMGGEKFQEALKATAREHGIAVDDIIKKQGSFRESLSQGWITAEVLTDTLNKFTVKGAKDYAQAMMESGKWTQAQADALIKEAQAMEDAATKVKTFTQLWDTLKESAQSGWAQSWEIIIGDFEEAKALFTEISDALGGVIQKISDSRNALLEGALGSGSGGAGAWDNLVKKINDAGVSTDTFKAKLIEVGKANSSVIEEGLAQGASFETLLAKGLFTADMFAEAIRKVAGGTSEISEATGDATAKLEELRKVVNKVIKGDFKNGQKRVEALTAAGYDYAEVQSLVNKVLAGGTIELSDLSDAQLKSIGLTEEQIATLHELAKEAEATGTPINELIDSMTKPTGRELLIDTLRNAFEGLAKVIGAIKEAWSNTFDALTSDDLYRIIEKIHEFSESLIMSDESAENFKKTFEGLFALFQLTHAFISASLTSGLKLLKAVLSLFDTNLLEVTAHLADYIIKFRDWVDENTLFIKTFDKLGLILKNIIDILVKLFNEFMELPAVQAALADITESIHDMSDGIVEWLGEGLKKFNEFVERVKSTDISLDNIGELFKDFVDNVLGHFLNVGDLFSNVGTSFRKFVDAVKNHVGNFSENIQNGASSIWESAKKIWSGFTNFIKGIDLGAVAAVALGVTMLFLVNKILDIVEMFASPLVAIKDMAKSVGGAFDAIRDHFKVAKFEKIAGSVLTLAISIGILAASVALLAIIPTDKLIKAGVALVVLTGIVAGLAVMCSKLKASANLTGVAALIASISASVLIMSFALEQLAKIELSDMPSVLLGLLGIVVTFGLILTAIKRSIRPAAMKSVVDLGIMCLLLSGSLLIMAKVIKAMAGISTGDLAKGLLAITAVELLFAGMIAVSKLAGANAVKAGAMLLLMSGAFVVMIGVVKIASMLEASEVLRATATIALVGGLFAALIAVSSFAGRNAAKAGVMLIGVAASMAIMVFVIKQIASMDSADIRKGISAIASLELLFAGIIAVSFLAGKNAVKAGTMLLLMSGALAILTGVIFILSAIDPEGLKRATDAITQLEICFMGIIAVSYLAKSVKVGPLAALAAAIGVLLIAVAALTMLDQEKLKNATIAMSALMAMFAVLIAVTKLSTGVKAAPLMTILVAVGVLAGIVAALTQLDTDSVLDKAASISVLLLSMSSAMVIAGKAGPMAKSGIVGLALMGLVVGELAVILGLMAHFDVNPSIETAGALSILLLSMSAALVILGVVGGAAHAALVGIGVLAVLIAGIGTLIVAIGALMCDFPMLETFLDKGIPVIEKIGYALGSFFGNIVGGLLGGMTSGIPAMASDLSAFMDNLQGFIDGAKNIDESVADGVKALAAAILALTAANLLDSITSWLTGGSSMVEFAEQLVPFGESLAAFSRAIDGKVNPEAVKNAATAAGYMADVANAIPSEGGLWQLIAGGKDLGEFGAQLTRFADNLTGFSRMVDGKVNAEAIKNAATAAQYMVDVANAIPAEGGLWQLIAGGKDLGEFGVQLSRFADNLAGFSRAVDGKINPGAFQKASTAAKYMVNIANAIPSEGGLWQLIAGGKDLGEFGAQMASFGSALAGFSRTVDGKVNKEAISNAMSAATSIVGFANTIPKDGGFWGNIFGDADMDTFGANLVSFGESFAAFTETIAGVKPHVVTNIVTAAKGIAELQNGLGGNRGFFSSDMSLKEFGKDLADFGKKFAEYYESVSGINISQLTTVIAQTKNIIQLISDVAGLDTSGVSAFVEALNELGKVSISGFTESISNSSSQINSAVSGMMNTFIRGIEAKKTAVATAISNVVKHSLSKVSSNNTAFRTAGNQMMNQLVVGVKSSNVSISNIFADITKKALSGIKKQESSFRSAGAALTAKLIDGIQSKTSGLGNAFSSVLSRMVSSIRSHYSSFYSAGGYLAAGFAKGISANAQLAANAAAAMAGAARAAVSKELQINSPSKVGYVIGGFFTEGVANGISGNTRLSENASIKMAKETIDATEEAFDKGKFAANIGKMISDGLAKGILKNSDKVAKASNKTVTATKKAFEESSNWINKNKEANNISLVEELSAWERVQSRYKAGSEEHIKAEEEISRVRKELSEANEEYYQNVLSVQQETIEKRKELDEDYYNKSKEINDKLAKDIQDLEDEYTNAFTSRRDALYNSYKLFEEVDPSEYVGSDTLINNLQSQVKAIDEWSTHFNQLSSKISESGLVEELRELGVSSASQIKALNSMTEAELNKYVALWKEKHTLAASQAREELQEMDNSITNKIYEMKDQADVELESYKNAWIDSIQKLNDESQAKLDELKITWMQKVAGLKVDTTSEFTKMSNEITNILGQSSRWSNAGANIIEGVLSGVVNSSASLYTEVENVMATALSTAKEALDINSPSKEFEKIGIYSDEGFVNGLRKYAYKVAGSAEYVGRNMLDALRSSISRIASAVEDGIDTQPTIRPVLDLSNVESGAAKLNTMFSRTQAMSISTGMRRGVKEELPNESADSKVGSTYNFTQNNYSPKSLSRSEIYRQTKNQFSAFERMVKA